MPQVNNMWRGPGALLWEHQGQFQVQTCTLTIWAVAQKIREETSRPKGLAWAHPRLSSMGKYVHIKEKFPVSFRVACREGVWPRHARTLPNHVPSHAEWRKGQKFSSQLLWKTYISFFCESRWEGWRRGNFSDFLTSGLSQSSQSIQNLCPG